MDNNYLEHHGVKGQKWGVRRYQTKDGSLTPAGKKRYSKGDGKKKKPTPEETTEQKRARLLKSTDAHELYKNKHLLTTAEINERLTRIDTEKRLGAVAAQDKRGFAKFMENAQKVVKTADDIYKLTQSDAVKAIMKKFNGEEDGPKYNKDDVESILKVKSKLSNKDLEELAKRHENLGKLEKKLKDKKDTDEATRKAKEDANKEEAAKKAKEYDDAREAQDKANRGYENAKGTKEATGGGKRSTDSGSSDNDGGVKGLLPGKKDSGDEPLTGEIIGEGTSKRQKGVSPFKEKSFETIDVDFTETPMSSDKLSGFITTGGQVLYLLDQQKGLTR